MKTQRLKVTPRSEIGSAACRRLRQKGYVPSVLYGRGKDSFNLSIQKDTLAEVLRHHGKVLELELPESVLETVVIKDVQYDALGERILHVDLHRVSLDERMQTDVLVQLRGVPKGVTADGAVLSQRLKEIRIECLPAAVPESISVIITSLRAGEFLRARDLQIPDGATLVTDPDEVVAALEIKKEEEEEEEAFVGSPTEPELISKGPKAEAEQ